MTFCLIIKTKVVTKVQRHLLTLGKVISNLKMYICDDDGSRKKA